MKMVGQQHVTTREEPEWTPNDHHICTEKWTPNDHHICRETWEKSRKSQARIKNIWEKYERPRV